MKGRSSSNVIEMRTFTEKEYHQFFRQYQSDPLMDPTPFKYNREQISRSFAYNHGKYRENYVHMGIFLNGEPVGSFQLKRMDQEKKTCEFGIILQNDTFKNHGIGTEAIRIGMKLAHEQYGINTIYGETMGRNKRMIRVFDKLGFTLIETNADSFKLPDGTKEDRLIFLKDLKEVCE